MHVFLETYIRIENMCMCTNCEPFWANFAILVSRNTNTGAEDARHHLVYNTTVTLQMTYTQTYTCDHIPTGTTQVYCRHTYTHPLTHTGHAGTL